MAAPGVYCHRTLNDNWVEDRCQPAGSLVATGNYHRRSARPAETELAYIGERYDVLSRISRMPNRETYATPDDGFRERLTTHKTDFKSPKSHLMFSGKQMSAPCLIHTGNAPVTMPEPRPLPGTESGFGSLIPRHPKKHEQRFWSTTHGEHFGEGCRKRTLKAEPSIRNPAGTSTEADENRMQGMKCGSLCGESFFETSDPSMDTRTQRAWLPGGDAGIRNIHLGGTRKSAPVLDNDLSLPLGNGAMSKIRSDLKERQGRLCRVSTCITKGAHMKSGMALFQDD